MTKRPSASIFQTNRKGWRRSPFGSPCAAVSGAGCDGDGRVVALDGASPSGGDVASTWFQASVSPPRTRLFPERAAPRELRPAARRARGRARVRHPCRAARHRPDRRSRFRSRDPVSRAWAATAPTPSADSVEAPPRRPRPASVACRSVPSGANTATGRRSPFANRRRTRSASVSAGPAGSVAAMRTAAAPSGKHDARARACQRRVRSPHRSRAAVRDALERQTARWLRGGRSVPADASRVANRSFPAALVLAAPKIAAPTAFVHSIRDASALHNHAGHALVASAASRGLRNGANSDSTFGMRHGTRCLRNS